MLDSLGYAGTAVMIAAYAPQIWHLYRERCSAGISVRAYALWIGGSLLFLGHATIIEDPVFTLVQVVNVLALSASWSSPVATAVSSASCTRSISGRGTEPTARTPCAGDSGSCRREEHRQFGRVVERSGGAERIERVVSVSRGLRDRHGLKIRRGMT